MKQIMVISHDTYASGLTIASDDIDAIASLAAGAFAIVDKDPDSTTYNHFCDLAAASESQTPKWFQFVTNTANGLKWSPVIEKAKCEVIYQAYVAPVAKVMNINVSLANPEVGTTAGFIVTDLTKAAHVLSRNRSYEHVIVTGDDEAAINAALIALVNADASRVVTASSGTDIVLTATTAGNNFQVSPTGVFRSSVATITTTTPNVLGTGLATQMATYEDMCEIEQGNGNYPQYREKVFTKVSEVNTTTPGTYHSFLLRYNNPTNRNLLTGLNPNQELVVAVLSTLTAAGTADKSLEALTNFEADFNV